MDTHPLSRLFNPRSVAVVGAKRANEHRWLRCVSTFHGPVYSVNIDTKEIPGIEALGVKNYPSLMDIPGTVDYVIVSVPREVAPIVVRDCLRKGVGGVTLISMTGGQSVVTTDAFAKAGLRVPVLTERSYARLSAFFNIVGGSYRNPIDMGSNWEAEDRTAEILEILDEDANIDIIVFELSLNLLFRRLETHPSLRAFLMDMLLSHKRRTRKPFLAIVTPSYVPEAEEELTRVLLAEGIPSFPTFHRAAKALTGCIEYRRFLAEH